MPRPRTKPIKTIAAVERALCVLDAFRNSSGSLSFSDVVAATGLLKTTVFRILLTLEEAGYIVRLQNGRLQLSAIFLHFAAAYRNSFRLEDYVLPVLHHLVEVTHESATLYVREGNQRLCLFRVDSRQPVRDVMQVGKLQPIDDTAPGLILREFLETSFPSDESLFQGMMRATIGKGSTPQVASVAGPVFNAEGLIGALSVSGPRERFADARITAIQVALSREALALSKRLGALGPKPAYLPSSARSG